MDTYDTRRSSGNYLLLFSKPDYYDAPEGQNPWEKIWGINKYAIATSLATGIVDCFLVTQAKNPVEVVNCMAFWAVPLVGMSTTFASITYMATNIRGKDDKINYALGAMACAPILHAWRHKLSFTMWGTAILTCVALLKKDSKQKGWQFFYDPVHYYGNYTYDFSLIQKEWPKRPY